MLLNAKVSNAGRRLNSLPQVENIQPHKSKSTLKESLN